MRRINDLSVEDLVYIATYDRQAKYKEDNRTLVIIDEGMSDAACRMMANRKLTSGFVVGSSELPKPQDLEPAYAESALANIEHCVVGLLERWQETKAVVHHWFPWLKMKVRPHI